MLTEREQEIEQYLKEPTAIGIDKDVALSLLSTIQILREKIEKYDQDYMEHDKQKLGSAMKLYEFTRKKNGRKVYIRSEAITAISFDDGDTQIFTVGDMIPFTVKESLEEVISTLRDE